MEALEPLGQELAKLEQELAGGEAARQEAAAALASAENEIDAEAASISAERGALASGLPADLAATYERLRERLGGIGAARLTDGRCSGCHLALPTSERERVLNSPPGTLAYCDQCGRILVP